MNILCTEKFYVSLKRFENGLYFQNYFSFLDLILGNFIFVSKTEFLKQYFLGSVANHSKTNIEYTTANYIF